jgi:hypothetical protein
MIEISPLHHAHAQAFEQLANAPRELFAASTHGWSVHYLGTPGSSSIVVLGNCCYDCDCCLI